MSSVNKEDGILAMQVVMERKPGGGPSSFAEMLEAATRGQSGDEALQKPKDKRIASIAVTVDLSIINPVEALEIVIKQLKDPEAWCEPDDVDDDEKVRLQ